MWRRGRERGRGGKREGSTDTLTWLDQVQGGGGGGGARLLGGYGG